ncbi:MAG: protein kinase domain-containing protein [Chloroflexota bacterium]
MRNPYVSRGPLRNAAMFYGRNAELNEIAAFLGGNQSVSIVGSRKIGKTSLLFHLMRPETRSRLHLGPEYLFVYLDCEVLGEGHHEEIFGQLAVEIGEALHEQGLPTEPALDEAIKNPGRLAFERAVRRLNQRGLRVVLMMDEFERLSTNPNLDVNFFNALRSAAGRYQLAFITASARPLIQLTYSERAQSILSSPFFNIFAPMFLGLFSQETAYQLMDEPSRQAGLPMDAQMQGFLYTFAGGHPLTLQVACFYALEELSRSQGDVDLEVFRQAIERRAGQELSAHFEYYWHNLALLEQTALRQVNDLADRAVSDTTLRAVLRDLVQKCLLVNEDGIYRYPSRAWAAFVASQTMPAAAGIGSGLTSGTRIGPYEVLSLLGRGGMAEVYKGLHTRLERTVAIKVLSSSMALEADFRARFEREARAIAALRHPNIVQMFDFGDVDGLYYMVMEFIAGKDLAHLIAENGPLPLDLARSLAGDVASALDYAHFQDLVHRDVKPSNVLLQISDVSLRPRAILTDFGIAKILGGDTGATKTGLMMGTLNYMAPEQIRSSGQVDGRADVYSLGIVTYQMLTGHLPFTADNPGAMMLAHLQQEPADPLSYVETLPSQTVQALCKALEKDPNERFATAGEFVQLL